MEEQEKKELRKQLKEISLRYNRILQTIKAAEVENSTKTTKV